MTDRDEQILQKLEVTGQFIQRGRRKVKAQELVMAEKYLLGAITEIRNLMKWIRGE